MHKKIFPVFLLVFVLMICLFSCKRTSVSADSQFRQFTNALFCQEVSANSISLHYTLLQPKKYGIDYNPDTFGTFDIDNRALCAAVENYQAVLAGHPREELNKENRMTYDILQAYFQSLKEGAAYTLYQEPLAPLTGIQSQLPVLMSEYSLHNTDDIDDYLTLLATTGDYFDSLIRYETKKGEQGLFLSRSTAESLIKECTAFVNSGSRCYLNTTFQERLKKISTLSPQKQTIYVKKNRSIVATIVLPAYKKLIAFLEEKKTLGKNENGLSHYKNGKNFYQYLVQTETGSSRTIREMQNLTYQQMQQDLTSLDTTLASKKGQMGAASISQSINQKFLAKTPESILNYLNEKMTDTFPACPETKLSVKYVPTDLEPYLSPAFYMIPPLDYTAENTIYINRSSTPSGISLFTTLAHEGYPGHLYQTLYFQAKKRDNVRSILDYSGYIEGWATYVEMCSYYLSPLSRTQATLLQKNASITLALYALADMGIHYDGWTLLDTITFFKTYGITDLQTVTDIFQLIVGDPGNYLKYYIGYVEFLELKKAQMKTLGDRFSQTEFHRAVLDAGPAPFDLVKQYISDMN